MSIACLWLPDFYAAVEQRDAPEYAGRPLVVGAAASKGGKVLSASPEARARGVQCGMEVGRAQELCPELIRQPTDLRRYREVHAALRARVREANPRSEAIHLDGFYVDWGLDAAAVAHTEALGSELRAAQRIPIQLGLGPTCFIAYLAAQQAEPAGDVHAVRGAAVLGFVGAHPPSALWGLGPSAQARLAERGVRSVAALRELGAGALEEIVGPRNARSFLALARGEDRGRIPLQAQPKSLSRLRSFRPGETDPRALAEALAELAGDLEEQLQRERCQARAVRLDVQFEDGARAARSATRDPGVSRGDAIAELAVQLLERARTGMHAVRRLRLQAMRLEPLGGDVGRQLRLF